MRKLIKPKFFLGVSLALISIEIAVGLLLGYFIAKFFSGEKPGAQGKIKSLVFRIGRYELHPHHWSICAGVLGAGLFYNILPFPLFASGFLGGLIFQGIFCYDDWYKILIK